MVYVRLAQDWTAPDGTAHAAGAMVEVDAATLAELEADGTVSEDGGSDTDGWPGPSVSGGGKDGGGDADGWPGPSVSGGGKDGGGDADGWPGPS